MAGSVFIAAVCAIATSFFHLSFDDHRPITPKGDWPFLEEKL